MTQKDLSIFVDVARLGSFAAAAKARGVDPSSVSRAIAQLEDNLGLRLFQRSTRRMSLTQAGELYLDRMVPLLDELTQIEGDIRGLDRAVSGTLRLSASVSFGMARIVPLLGRFRSTYPDVQVECVFTDSTLDLVAERIDLAVRLAPTVQGDLIVSKLADTRYRVVASPGYLANAPPLSRPEHLSSHRALLFPYRGYRTSWRFRDADGAEQVQPVAGDLVMTPASALHAASRDGLGPALLPDWLVDVDIASGALVHCLPGWQVTATSFDTAAWLVYPSRSFLPAKVRVMIDFLRAEWQSV